RCDPTAIGPAADHKRLYCVDGTCQAATAPPGAPAPPQPSVGTNQPAATGSNDILSCLGCANTGTSSAVLFGATLVSLRGLKRLARRRP
ncbi:MAG TPA: hypothetical protein VGO62_10355, partial [Myxococcota bacterium]